MLPTLHPPAPDDRSPLRPTPESVRARRDALLSELPAHWRALVIGLWQVAGPERLAVVPGSSGGHHAHEGGLLLHLVEVAEIAQSLAAQPAHVGLVDVPALVAGALVHDLGKVGAYVPDVPATEEASEGGPGRPGTYLGSGPWAYTDDERLVHHMGVGLEMAATARERYRHEPWMRQIAEGEWRWIRHAIVSHHGSRAHGSMRAPEGVAAMLLHLADMTSAESSRIRSGWRARHPGHG